MKGSISEFELGVLRARMLDAARAKARRGELRIPVPIGYIWHREIGLGFDPDIRVQEAVRQIFGRFRQLGSARQVHLSLRADALAALGDQRRLQRIDILRQVFTGGGHAGIES
jgi:DNA invertase Pin-like site-specific DNA recombinase